MSKPNIVVLDGFDLNNGDLSWSDLHLCGEVTIHQHSEKNQVIDRCRNYDYVVSNKVILGRSELEKLPKLKGIFVSATGYNNIDTTTARRLNIDVCNVQGYGSSAVAQHVFGLILQISNRVAVHNQAVKIGEWSKINRWSFWKEPTIELKNKTMGIVGYGKIGKRVAMLAQAFEMNVVVSTRTKIAEPMGQVQEVAFDELLMRSDIISLNAPLTDVTSGIMNRSAFIRMKETAMLINTSRGGLIVEEDLYEALSQGLIGYAGLDVLNDEPPRVDNSLLTLDNCIVTPHMAWVSKDTRSRLLNEVVKNIRHHIEGRPINVVN